MAQLSSPGVSVSVIDESFYTPAAPGTVPLIIVASAESKQNGAGTGTAPGTLKANAGNVYLLTSQKDLSDTFGTPIFKTDANNNPIHAGEQNEYGLQAAYSFLGVSNRAYVVRADVDLAQLDASADAPAGPAADGTYWFDTADTHFGIFEWNSSASTVTGGQTFTNKIPLVITDKTKLVGQVVDGDPLPSIGSIGDYAIVATTTLNKLYYKKAKTHTAAGIWVEVGSQDWKASWPTAQGTVSNSTGMLDSGDSITINGTPVSGVTDLDGLVAAINTLSIPGVTADKPNGKLELYSTGDDIVISGTTVAKVGLAETTYKAPSLQISKHTSVPTFKRTDFPSSANGIATGAVWVKTTNPNLGADWIVKKYSEATKAWTVQPAPLYPDSATALANLDATGGGINLGLGRLYVKYNDDEGTPALANFKIYARNGVGATVIKSAVINTQFTTTGGHSSGAHYKFTISETDAGSSVYTDPVEVEFIANHSANDADTLLAALTAALAGSNIVAVKTTAGEIQISHVLGGDIKLTDLALDGSVWGRPLSKIFSTSTTSHFYADPTNGADLYVASLWTDVVAGTAIAPASATAPTTKPADGQLWYNSIVDEVDIMVHNGDTWVGYANYTQNQVGGDETDPAGPIVSATQPLTQSDGSPLGNGDLWIDTSDLENYPTVRRYNYLTKKWALVDNSDQTTEEGILFHDARWSTNGRDTSATIADLLTSDFLDPDAPDPALYPKGMLLWNLRRSGFNVKKYVVNYIDTSLTNHRYQNEHMDSLGLEYNADRWVSVAANQENGAGTFGRHAQRKVVVQALQALVNSNQQIRDEESRIFNLLATPGYPELIGEMISLNYDRGISAFVVGDTPARLKADATTLSNWGYNTAGALEDNDQGLASFDEYLGVFYPWGYTSDNIGNNVVVPPSHMMLRTIALNDQVSYPWFAPAGTRRGGITNATAVGYVDPTSGEFQSVALNTGQRDTLAAIKVNPLTFITGTGLVNYGQYTRAKNASALDRINVARLVIYLRRQFTQLAKPYVFEPNDKITRDEIKGAAESLLLELVGQRALYDYIVVCDTSNNTPSRIDRSELYLDVAIEPVKAVEFIYIPLRLKNTGEIKALGGA
jgi:hypothetical protein